MASFPSSARLMFFICSILCLVLFRCFFFFFSSRRRHTRSTRDWSSDVCSSDLEVVRYPARREVAHHFAPRRLHVDERYAARARHFLFGERCRLWRVRGAVAPDRKSVV